MQSETRSHFETIKTSNGDPVAVLRFEGDIASTSTDAVLGAYQSLPADSNSLILDFAGVEYINSSGIALVIQLLMEADAAGQKVSICGLTPHFTKVFTMVGIPKYAALFPTPAEAAAAL